MMMTRKTRAFLSLGAALVLGSCGSDGTDLFTPKPECKGATVEAFAGTNHQVMSNLEIGTSEDGFDLDGDGKADNKLAAVSDIARAPIAESLKNYELVIPVEFFDLDALAADSCVKFGLYLGAYAEDTDGDGKKPYVEDGECNDKDGAIHKDAAEVAGDGKDNNCNGLADENGDVPSNDTMDRDGDGQTIMAGDCDDTNNMVKKGSPEICGDGFDNDCDGTADRTGGAMATACSPFDGTADIPIDPLSLDGTSPIISFKDGTIEKQGSAFELQAGPSVFQVNIPVADGIALELKITGARIKATLEEQNGTIVMKNGLLGGVLDARTADTIRGLTVDQIMLTPENSLLDATFANVLGPILSLPKAPTKIQQTIDEDCRTPDIDVDDDGLEAYCDSNRDDEDKSVDVCIDGDGTEVRDVVDGAGKVTMHCTEAMGGSKPRFVDGISVALKFETAPVKSLLRP